MQESHTGCVFLQMVLATSRLWTAWLVLVSVYKLFFNLRSCTQFHVIIQHWISNDCQFSNRKAALTVVCFVLRMRMKSVLDGIQRMHISHNNSWDHIFSNAYLWVSCEVFQCYQLENHCNDLLQVFFQLNFTATAGCLLNLILTWLSAIVVTSGITAPVWKSILQDFHFIGNVLIVIVNKL